MSGNSERAKEEVVEIKSEILISDGAYFRGVGRAIDDLLMDDDGSVIFSALLLLIEITFVLIPLVIGGLFLIRFLIGLLVLI